MPDRGLGPELALDLCDSREFSRDQLVECDSGVAETFRRSAGHDQCAGLIERLRPLFLPLISSTRPFLIYVAAENHLDIRVGKKSIGQRLVVLSVRRVLTWLRDSFAIIPLDCRMHVSVGFEIVEIGPDDLL